MVISSWSRQLSVSEHMGRPAASRRAAARTSRGVATPITRLRRLRARPHSEELEEVVGQTDQRPLGGDFVIAAEGEAPKGAALLRLTKDRLDDRLAARVDPPARRRTPLLPHPVRDRAPRPRCRRPGAALPVSVPPDRTGPAPRPRPSQIRLAE